MQLILSTDGQATPRYADSSTTPLVPVPQVEQIRYGRITGSGPNRAYAHIELTDEQARTLVAEITAKLG